MAKKRAYSRIFTTATIQVSAWGGYVFIINLIPLHVFVLLLMGRYSERIYSAYNTFFIISLLCSMQIPFVGFQPVRTSEHMASAGLFALLQAVAVLKYVQNYMSKAGSIAAGLVFLTVVALTWAGVVAPWSGRWDRFCCYTFWSKISFEKKQEELLEVRL